MFESSPLGISGFQVTSQKFKPKFIEKRQHSKQNHCLTLTWKTITFCSFHFVMHFFCYLSKKIKKTFTVSNTLKMQPTTLAAGLSSLSVSPSFISCCFLVSGNSFGNPNSQILQNMQIAPNMANPSHQFPTHRVSCIVNDVWTPSSTNIERKLESNTKPTAAPEMNGKKIAPGCKHQCFFYNQ